MKYKTVIITTAGNYSSVLQESTEEKYQSDMELFKSMFEFDKKLNYITLTDENGHDYVFNPIHVIGFEFAPVED